MNLTPEQRQSLVQQKVASIGLPQLAALPKGGDPSLIEVQFLDAGGVQIKGVRVPQAALDPSSDHGQFGFILVPRGSGAVLQLVMPHIPEGLRAGINRNQGRAMLAQAKSSLTRSAEAFEMNAAGKKR